MATLGANVANMELIANLTGLTHDIFVGDVRNVVQRESPTAFCFKEAPAGFFKWSGQTTKFAVDLNFKTSGRATDGKLPYYTKLDAVQGYATVIRRYDTLALDNLVELLASGEGSFEDLGRRIQKHLWNSWKNMEIRQSVGAASGLIAKCSSRTSSTVVVLKDGYGHAGTDPIMHLSPGAIVAWYDVSASGIGGAARVSSLVNSTSTVTMDSASTWEPSAQIAADDLIYLASVPDSTDAQFISERNIAANGVGTIVDPDGNASTVFNIAEGTYANWKPYRKASGTFDHTEVTEHWIQLGTKRGFDVSANTDKAITHGSCLAQLARSLMGFQQQYNLGGTLEGGYKTEGAAGNDYEPAAGLTIGGKGIYADKFFYHDCFVTMCTDALYRANLGGEADFWAGDGSMWLRSAGYDGKDSYAVEYTNYVSNHRGAHGALTGIAVDVTVSDFNASPSY